MGRNDKALDIKTKIINIKGLEGLRYLFFLGLKIRCPQGRGSSTLPTGTILIKAILPPNIFCQQNMPRL